MIARPRHQRLQLGGNLPDAVHAVVHEINLSAAIEFLLDRGLDQLFIPARDYRLDCDAIFGRRLDHAHVAQTRPSTCAGARNRRG